MSEPQVLNRGGWANGDVFLATDGAQQKVVKTYHGKPWIIRWLGRYLLGRERRVYRRLAGVPGIPQLLADADPLNLALEYIHGERISNQRLAQTGAAILRDLNRLVTDMHICGVYHLDLRNQGNILVAADNRCYLLDFASAVTAPSGTLRALLMGPLLGWVDQYGVSKWAARASTEASSA